MHRRLVSTRLSSIQKVTDAKICNVECNKNRARQRQRSIDDDRVVTVVTANGKKATQLGGLPLMCLVGILMRELAAGQLPDSY